MTGTVVSSEEVHEGGKRYARITALVELPANKPVKGKKGGPSGMDTVYEKASAPALKGATITIEPSK